MQTGQADLAQMRELPMRAPPPRETDIAEVHALIAGMTRTERGREAGLIADGQRPYIAGYDLFAPDGRDLLVLRYRARSDIDLPGVPLAPFAEGQKLHLVTSVAIAVSAMRREGPEGSATAWRKTRRPVIDKQERLRWFLARQERFGISVEQINMTDSLPRPFQDGRRRRTILETRIEARVTVTDVEKFAHIVCNGIGRYRHAGLGLVQYRPV